jgi:hypothetical protein
LTFCATNCLHHSGIHQVEVKEEPSAAIAFAGGRTRAMWAAIDVEDREPEKVRTRAATTEPCTGAAAHRV